MDHAPHHRREEPPAWRLDFPPELPITARREEIVRAIREHPVVILSGETGSGKTTQLPKFCLEAGRGTRGRIACTQPRRVAALSVSRRVAEELGVAWGREVGCKIRFNDQTSGNTVVKFLTDGMLLAEAQADRELRGYDTIIVDIFPNLLEHIELLSRLPQTGLKRIVFRRPSRTHGFFFSTNAHTRIDHYDSLGLAVYFYHEDTKDVYRHLYKKGCGFFVREELVRKFMESTILAFYGSALELDADAGQRIQNLLRGLTEFFGPTVGVLTGGGGGVMGLATEQARANNALTGSCFLELEAQPPKLGVDFFNTFQETARHNRQKWFEVADFCIFNVGGVGTLEEVGIELCNLKLGIRPRVPYVFYATKYWSDLKRQIKTMVRDRRAPRWMEDYVLFTDDADEVVAFYRKTLQVL